MRKILLASAAILGTAGGAWAQTATYQSQGTQALPWTNFYGANTNINANGTAQPGGVKLPDPGTVVIHLNGRVYADVDLSWSSLANIPAGANPASGVGYKSNPIGIASYLRCVRRNPAEHHVCERVLRVNLADRLDRQLRERQRLFLG
jgi:hypothetical protein